MPYCEYTLSFDEAVSRHLFFCILCHSFSDFILYIIHRRGSEGQKEGGGVFVCACVYIYMCVCTYLHVNVCMCVHMQTKSSSPVKSCLL